MRITVNEIINWFYSNYKDQLVQAHAVTADTLDGCFKKVYAMRRSARYDSERRYEFEDGAIEPLYQKWKEQNETLEMYYGSATVD